MERGNLVLKVDVGRGVKIGSDIEVTVVERRSGSLRLVIQAPKDVLIVRTELLDVSSTPTPASAPSAFSPASP